MTSTGHGGCGCGTCKDCASGAGPGRRGLVAPGRTHAAWKRRLVEGISAAPALAGLTTRADDDPALALSDAWAASLHVLSFYLERAQTEAFIGTATDIASLRGLAGQVGYTPRPAISAATTLTFTVDDFATSPQVVPIRSGSKVQTIPGPEELPVMFETSRDLEARPVWNKMPAKRWQMSYPKVGDSTVRVTETLLAARPGDIIGFVVAVADTPAADKFELVRVASLVSHSTGQQPHYQIDLDKPLELLTANANTKVLIFSRRASMFGYNAIRFVMLDTPVRARLLRTDLQGETFNPTTKEWPGLKASIKSSMTALALMGVSYVADPKDDNRIDLDAIYPEAMVNRHIVIRTPTLEGVFQITEVAEVSRSDHGVSSKVTRLTLDRPVEAFDNSVRDAAVYLQTEQLHVAKSPYTALHPAPDDRTVLMASSEDLLPGQSVAEVPAGRLVVVQGRSGGVLTAESATVERWGVNAAGDPFVTFDAALLHQYEPAELVILGNAVPATHGETKTPTAAMRPTASKLPIGEIIGSGDARRLNQGFSLRQPGLTHVSAPNALGYEPALQVRVDDEVRDRKDQLYGLDETSRSYALETAPDGRTVVRFAGRVRTAANNVSAVYRVGGGIGGNLGVDRLKTPMTMALGLREVTNPLPALGGVGPEDIESARQNAPIRIVSLDRIVSSKDYEGFARAYAGVAKAQGTLLWVGLRQVVHLTVAGPDGDEIAPGSTLYANLSAAIASATQPGSAFKLLPARHINATATIGLQSDPAFDRKSVEADVKAAIGATFSAAQRDFAAPLAKSAVIACVQAVAGVVAARVINLHSTFEANDTEILGAPGAHASGTNVVGAAYITLDPKGVTIEAFAT